MTDDRWIIDPIGRFTAFNGEARADRGSGVSTNALLHAEVLAALQ